MSQTRRSFLFGTLAFNQTAFFEAVGEVLEERGCSAAYLCFHERSHEYLLRKGRRSFNAYRDGAAREANIDFSAYSWPSLDFVLSHEKAAFEIHDTAPLIRKLRRYLAACEQALDDISSRSPGSPMLVQELGGFLSNAASFYAARSLGIDNVFAEPSFYRGRVFFVRNSFSACRVAGPANAAVSDEVRRYLREAVAKQEVVIPVKDARHYRGPIHKLFDSRNATRLLEKTVDRYLLGKKEEFGHIGGHVARHVRMLVNAKVLARHYRQLPSDSARFIYYPLHVPADVALTIRSPQYLDQYSLIDHLARVAPHTHLVVIKEHPAQVGAVDRRRIAELLLKRDNVRLLHPTINNYDVMRRADIVVTVNSKSGAEALLLGRPVVVLGDAFYRSSRLVHRVDNPADLGSAIARLTNCAATPAQEDIDQYFQDVWDASWPGELYVTAPPNPRTFADSLLRFIGSE